MKTRQRLQKEFENSQEAVKRSEILIPFVFYNGTNIPGGVCQMRKGDQAWLFLDKARKLGAQLGVGGSGKEWARVGVDDLMLVRSEVIIPHVCSPCNVMFSVKLNSRSTTSSTTSS